MEHRKTPSGTRTQQLASLLLGQPVETFVRTRRAEGRSWRLISRDLYDATGQQLDVSDVTLISWFGGREPETAAS
jgi:hypothetical protein